MSTPFPPQVTERLPALLLKRLRATRTAFAEDLPPVRDGVESLNASASVVNQLTNEIWEFWAYPQWEPVREQWQGPGPDEVSALARELLVAWETLCERIRASGESPPHYTFSAGVRAATLRRAGLGQPVEALTPMERECIRETLTRNSPYSEHLAPALWHALSLGLDVQVAAMKIAEVPAPKVADKDFKPQFTRALHSAFSRREDDEDRSRLRRNIAQSVLQHYGWVANTPLESLPLSFAAAFAAGLEEARPGLLPGADLVHAVRRVLGPDGPEQLQG